MLFDSKQFIDNADCIKCGDVAIRQFNWSVGTKFCLCPRHHGEAIEAERAFDEFKGDVFNEDAFRIEAEKLGKRIARCGLPSSVVEALGITTQDQAAQLGDHSDPSESVAAVLRFVKCDRRGVIVFSGPNGIGKSCAAALGAWRSRGRFVKRSEWSKLTTWDKDHGEMMEMIDSAGILVLDEVLQRSEGGDSAEAMRVINLITTERHDARRGTIITSRSSKEVFFKRLGNDILDRSREFEAVGGSGFVDLLGRSYRGVY
mgnify:CR=1 FL=1